MKTVVLSTTKPFCVTVGQSDCCVLPKTTTGQPGCHILPPEFGSQTFPLSCSLIKCDTRNVPLSHLPTKCVNNAVPVSFLATKPPLLHTFLLTFTSPCSEMGSLCIKFAERRGFSRIRRKDKKATTHLPALLQNPCFEQGKTWSKTSPFRKFDAESRIFPVWQEKIPLFSPFLPFLPFLPFAPTSTELCQ